MIANSIHRIPIIPMILIILSDLSLIQYPSILQSVHYLPIIINPILCRNIQQLLAIMIEKVIESMIEMTMEMMNIKWLAIWNHLMITP